MAKIPIVVDAHVHLRGTTIEAERFAAWSERSREIFGFPYRFALIPFSEKWSYYPKRKEVSGCHEMLMQYLEQYPDLFYGWAYVNPADTDFALKQIDKYVANGPFIGIKLWVARKASEPEAIAIFKRAAELKVPVLQHAWDKACGQLKDESKPEDVAIAAQEVPKCNIIMAHMGGFWQKGLKVVAPYPNIHVDCSGGWAMNGSVEKAVSLLGSERVLFGSDLPFRDIPTQLSKVLSANIPKTDKRQILGRNFLSLINSNEEE